MEKDGQSPYFNFRCCLCWDLLIIFFWVPQYIRDLNCELNFQIFQNVSLWTLSLRNSHSWAWISLKAILHKRVWGNKFKFDTLVDFLSLISKSHIDSELAEFNGEGIRFPCCRQTHCLVASWQAGKHPVRGFVFFFCLLLTRKKGPFKGDFF